MESLADLEALLKQRADNPVETYDADTAGTDRLPSDARIVGGNPVAPGTYPFYAYGAGTILCGATLIHEDILLTAAHCGGAFAMRGALIGGIFLNGTDATLVGVDQEFPNPDYVDATRVNDIMLVKLTNPSAAPLVTLNMDPAVPAEGDVLTVTGFGDTSDGGDPSPILLDVEVDTFSDDFCDQLYTVYEPTTMICAGKPSYGRRCFSVGRLLVLPRYSPYVRNRGGRQGLLSRRFRWAAIYG
jgi:secreted trypsin-like serine protease